MNFYSYPKSMIGFKEKRLNFKPLEFINDEKMSEDYYVYAYIAPRSLNSEEQLKIEKYKATDSEYYKGVHEGWSILFLGSSDQVVVAAGIRPKNEMLKKIPPNFWELYPDKTFYLLDGTLITKEYIESL